MNEDSNYEHWVTISSSEESCDSDKIDSDIEAELYSAIHHEAATSIIPTDQSNCPSPKITVTNQNSSKEHQFGNSDLYTSFESPQVNATNNFNNRNLKRKSDASVIDLKTTSFETPKVTSESSNRNNKRKSDVSINDLENSTQIKSNNKVGSIKSKNKIDAKSRKKQKTASQENSRKEFDRTSVLNATIVCDTSDSDSILWSEADEREILLQTNVAPEIVALSSDSFSDESFEPFEDVCSFRGTPVSSPQPSTSFNSKDPWNINSEDLFRSKGRGKSGRYHVRAALHCTNCNQKGHTVKFCSVPKAVKCYVCGGNHMALRCRDKVCGRCFGMRHDSRTCNQRFVDYCLLCNMRGHPVKYCPDLWRRYHLTTTRENIVVANPVPQDSPLYCFTCGEQGHYGAQCKIGRPDRYNFLTWTSVIGHIHPSDTIKRVMEDKRHTALGGISNWVPINTFQQQRLPLPIPQIQRPIPKKKNKKKKNNTSEGFPITKSKKKKKNRATVDSNTPENTGKTTTKKEFSFPRTPKSDRKNFKGKRNRFNTEPYKNALHRRLGLSSASGVNMHNNNFV